LDLEEEKMTLDFQFLGFGTGRGKDAFLDCGFWTRLGKKKRRFWIVIWISGFGRRRNPNFKFEISNLRI